MYDVIAVGNALVDHEFIITEEVLKRTGLVKGNMTLASFEEQQALLQTYTQAKIISVKQTGGGSAANSMYALACLGGKAFYSCRVGDDAQGQFYLQDLNDNGVTTSNKSITVGGVTGTCVVSVTPDAERTMQTYLGASSEINEANIDFEALADTEWLYLEGYLAMSKSMYPALVKLRQQAGIHNTKIAVSFADPSVIKFGKEGVLKILGNGVDLIFCNIEEAQLFTGKKNIKAAARALTEYCRIAVVTNSADGAVVCEKTDDNIDILEIATPKVANVIDTNGAGDSYAGTFLYALTQHYTLTECGRLAGEVASQVIQQIGPRLKPIQYHDIAKHILNV